MKISYLNFWQQKHSIDFWLSNFCQSIFNEKIKIAHYSDNPDILFCSCFGQVKTITPIKAKIKVLFIGENTDRKCFSEYKNEELISENFDLILSFDHNDIKNNKLRMPLWLTFYDYFTMDKEENFITNIQKKHEKNKKMKKFFGSLVCRHDRNNSRKPIFNELSKYGKVICGGKYMNKGLNIGIKWKDKLNFIKHSEFNICSENSARTGYCTEKIIHAFEAGCVPLYWGKDLPEKEVLNKNSYIFVNINNPCLMKKQIKKGIENKDKYLTNDIFTKKASYVLNNYYKTLEWQLKLKLGIIPKQKIYGISYASRYFIARKNQENKIKKCKYFHEFKMYGEEDISDKFKIQNKEIWYNSERGGGWWIWKPYIIYEKLNSIMDNDILIYFDGGCTVNNTTQKARKRFNEYIEMVNNHWTGHLRFRSNYKEIKYTNQYTIKYFKNRYNMNMVKHILCEQLLGGIQIIRKTKFTMDFFKEILAILEDNKYLFCEKYTKPGEFHRHDQSVMSVLYKLMGGNLIIPDETWWKGPHGGFKANYNYPIWATRFRVKYLKSVHKHKN